MPRTLFQKSVKKPNLENVLRKLNIFELSTVTGHSYNIISNCHKKYISAFNETLISMHGNVHNIII